MFARHQSLVRITGRGGLRRRRRRRQITLTPNPSFADTRAAIPPLSVLRLPTPLYIIPLYHCVYHNTGGVYSILITIYSLPGTFIWHVNHHERNKSSPNKVNTHLCRRSTQPRPHPPTLVVNPSSRLTCSSHGVYIIIIFGRTCIHSISISTIEADICIMYIYNIRACTISQF